MKIILCSDPKVLLSFFIEKMEGSKHEVVHTRSYEDALEKVPKNGECIVISDSLIWCEGWDNTFLTKGVSLLFRDAITKNSDCYTILYNGATDASGIENVKMVINYLKDGASELLFKSVQNIANTVKK